MGWICTGNLKKLGEKLGETRGYLQLGGRSGEEVSCETNGCEMMMRGRKGEVRNNSRYDVQGKLKIDLIGLYGQWGRLEWRVCGRFGYGWELNGHAG